MSSRATPSETTVYEQRWRTHLEGILARDAASLQALYDETSRPLYALALRILNDRDDAEEVILDVYHQVWNSAERYDSSRGNIFAWLSIITRNRAIDRVRQSKTRRTRELPIEGAPEAPSETPGPEQQNILAQEAALVRRAIATLGKEQRQAIELAFFSGLTHSDIAEALGMPLGTIKTRIRVGLQRLRKALPANAVAFRIT
jgi:RNA polymerase sigma-70 factor (ECF subfamily)